jgi:hypothetical protein
MANRCELASGDHTCSRHYGGRGPSLKWLKPWVVRSPRRSRGRRQLNRSRFAVGAGSQKPQNQSARPDGMEPGPRWRRACRRRVYSPVAPTRGWPLATSAPTFCVTPSSGLSHQSSSSAAGPRSSSNVPSAPRNGQPISRCSHEAKKKRKRKAGWMEVSHGDVLQHQASLVQTWRGAGTDGIAITLNQLILYKHPSCSSPLYSVV